MFGRGADPGGWRSAVAPLFLAALPACHDESAEEWSSAGSFAEFEVTVYDPERVQSGSTVFGLPLGPDGETPGAIYEVDFNGKVLWSHRLNEEQNPPGHYMLDAEPTKDETFLASIPGIGVFEFDRDGNELFSYYDPYLSHDSDKLDTGGVIFVRGFAPRGEDQVVELDAAGDVVWSWNGLDHYQGDPYDDFVDETDTWGHPTGVRKYQSGGLRVTMRNFNAIVELDDDGVVQDEFTFQSEASEGNIATEGTVVGQRPHDTDRVYDSERYLAPLREPLRVVEVERASGKLTWQWAPDEDEIPQTCLRDANRMSNGNVLLALGGSLKEITRDKEVVWELVSPFGAEVDTAGSLERKMLYKAVRVETDGTIIGN